MDYKKYDGLVGLAGLAYVSISILLLFLETRTSSLCESSTHMKLFGLC